MVNQIIKGHILSWISLSGYQTQNKELQQCYWIVYVLYYVNYMSDDNWMQE